MIFLFIVLISIPRIGANPGVLFLCFFLYLPIVAVIPSDIGNGLNYFADTLLFGGAALLLADALPKEDHPYV
jgi:hypothetical protein